jgi:hypothetical protein
MRTATSLACVERSRLCNIFLSAHSFQKPCTQNELTDLTLSAKQCIQHHPTFALLPVTREEVEGCGKGRAVYFPGTGEDEEVGSCGKGHGSSIFQGVVVHRPSFYVGLVGRLPSSYGGPQGLGLGLGQGQSLLVRSLALPCLPW